MKLDIAHCLRVASNFKITSHDFWLGLFHDSVENGWLPKRTCKIWPALDAITRREGEVYLTKYIPRVKAHPVARRVKLADLADNHARAPESLMHRYGKAVQLLTAEGEG